MEVVVFDAEGDSLTPTKLHVVSWHDGKLHSTPDYNEMRELFFRAEILVGHNITRWDIPAIERLLKITIKARLIDTLALSWYLYPKNNRHGLADWGEEFGIPKPPIDDWTDQPYEVYKHRCEEDVKINLMLWKKMETFLLELYGTWDKADRVVRYIQFKMDCAREQEENKWKLDSKKAERALSGLLCEREASFNALSKVMPRIPVYTDRKKPAKPFKKDGTPSVTGARWSVLLGTLQLPADYNKSVKELVAHKDPNPGSPLQVKEWLYSLGWVPEHFVYKRDKDTGDVKKIPQIKSEHEEGELCGSVLRLIDKEPSIESLSGLSIVKHRIGFLEGFLKNADRGDRVEANIAGLTNTLRFKHKAPLANIPGVVKPYGKVIRGCLTVDEGWELCGSDQVSLEQTTKLHYMYDYDPEYVADMSAEGFDAHLDLAKSDGKITQDGIDAYLVDGNKDVKAMRRSYKAANYACIYGVGAATLARGIESTKGEAQKLIDVYWKRNWAVKTLSARQIVKTVDGQMWLFNPVSKFWYSLRHKKDVFSTLNQGTGVYCFDTWVKYVRGKGRKITAQFHDEVVLRVKKGNREKCEALLKWAIDETNNQLKLNVKLDVDVQFGNCYADIH